MTETNAPSPGVHRLGREAAERLRLPGPPLGQPVRQQVGILARSVQRFASGISRPVDVRLALRGPGQSSRADVRPPRWWTPMAEATAPEASVEAGTEIGTGTGTTASGGNSPWLRTARAVSPATLPRRGLQRAARKVDDEQSYAPGGMLSSLTTTEAHVRRHPEVAASGTLVAQQDRRLATPAHRAPAPTPAPVIRRWAATSGSVAKSSVVAPSGATPPAAEPPVATRSASGPTTAQRSASETTVAKSPTAEPTVARGSVVEPVETTGGTRPAATPQELGPSAARTSMTKPVEASLTEASTADSRHQSAVDGAGSTSSPTAGQAAAPASPGATVRARAPWALAAPPTRFARTLQRGTAPTMGPPRGAPARRAVTVGMPVRAATVGLLDRAPALPGGLALTALPATPARPAVAHVSARPAPGARPHAVADRMPAPSSGAAPHPSVGRLGTVRAVSPRDAVSQADSADSAVSAGPIGSSPASASAMKGHGSAGGAAAGSGTRLATSQHTATSVAAIGTPPRPSGTVGHDRDAASVASAPTIRRYARSRQHNPARPPSASIAMPDQFVVRRWSRHGRRDSSLASGFGVDTPIRPATAGNLRTVRRPAEGAPVNAEGARVDAEGASFDAQGAGATGQPAGFATAPWVAATASGPSSVVTSGPRIGQRTLPAPSTSTSAPSSSTSAPSASTSAPSAFGGAWALAAPRRMTIGQRGSVSAAAPSASTSAPSASTGAPSAGDGVLRSLPVAPPRTGPVSRETPARPHLPAPLGASDARQLGGTAAGAAGPFTAADIERIRSGSDGGSLVERTADLFAAAVPGTAAARHPSPDRSLRPSTGPASGHEPDRPLGGSAVFHPTTTDGVAPAASLSDPWRNGVPDPWTDGHENAEPTGATLDRIVDAVVERIEDRVIDELERRGRHEWRVV